MTNITKKFVAGFAAVALLASSFSGVALAGTTIEITGNGAESQNTADVSQNSTTEVTQNNDADVTNNVTSNAKTGGNDANLNTGGDVYITTGDASTETIVKNTLNSNSAEVDCCASGYTDVMISGNGADSNNQANISQRSKTTVDQDNDADVTNNVTSNAKTGYNDARSNTGGDVNINTGKAETYTYVSTMANVNSARIASDYYGDNQSASFYINGNGAGSQNQISATLARTTDLEQDNEADVENNVEANAKTGKNDANLNTGGDVMIDTGKASVEAIVDNAVNFNYADLDCGCVWDVHAKIAGNGAGEESQTANKIKANLQSNQIVGQDNDADLDNNLEDLNAKTGYNDAESNTGEAESDPSINTGDAYAGAAVENSGNVNTLGSMMDWDWPDMPEMEFNFNMAAMWAFFGMSF